LRNSSSFAQASSRNDPRPSGSFSKSLLKELVNLVPAFGIHERTAKSVAKGVVAR
jgi:hypothetical protein